MSSKPKSVIIIALVLFVLFSAGVFFFISDAISKSVEQNNQNTASLSPQVRSIISTKNAAALHGQQPTNEPIRFKKYVYLSEGYTMLGDESLNFYFDTQLNDKLGTTELASATDIDGIVLNDFHREDVGYYEKDDVLTNIISAISDEESQPERNAYKKAMKVCYVLTFVSVPDGTVLRRDSLWGGEPPRRLKQTDSMGIGSHPSHEEIINLIKSRIQ